LSLTGCGLDIPQPTQQQVLRDEVVGTTWQYNGFAPATNCEITFNSNSTYFLIRRLPDFVATNSGSWGLARSYLELFPSDRFSPLFERQAVVRWWFTDMSTNRVGLFGGDSADPHRWARLSRVGSEPGVARRPFPVVIGVLQTERVDLVRTIGFSLVAGLA